MTVECVVLDKTKVPLEDSTNLLRVNTTLSLMNHPKLLVEPEPFFKISGHFMYIDFFDSISGLLLTNLSTVINKMESHLPTLILIMM